MTSNPVPKEENIIEALLHQLNLQREAYLETSTKIEALLTSQLALQKNPTSSSAASPPVAVLRRERQLSGTGSPRSSFSKSPADPFLAEFRNRQSTGLSTFRSGDSRVTGDSDDDLDENLYVTTPLLTQHYDHEGFRKHLQTYSWDEYGRQVLDTIVDNPERMQRENLFPQHIKRSDDRSHYTHCQVFDVGTDGAPVPTYDSRNEENTSRAIAIWHAIADLNPSGKPTKAVGRITIMREPSPILWGAAHYAHNQIFDVDELFKHLVQPHASSPHMHRVFDTDKRRQRSFVFCFEYFTIIGDDCRSTKWQISDGQEQRKPNHIPISRCSAVVALSLGGNAVRKLRNPSRRAAASHGLVQDIWSPWQVLNLQQFPDWQSSTDAHDSTKHYVNGVEAFMATLLAEFTDAEKRFECIYREVSALITPPLEFMFNSGIRDKLLFEDSQFTYSRRYFWAFQTCGIMMDSIKSLIDAYEDTFTDEVWEGKHKSLWPLIDQAAPRNAYFRNRMRKLKTSFETEISKLRKLEDEFHDRRKHITSLRDSLFSGTSVLESRKSVEMAEITIQQGHNIKLLTMVSIFFLPLTFVTSVFGMTNMPTTERFSHFAIATVAICIPFFVLVGSLNSTRVMHFWINKFKDGFQPLGRLFTRFKLRNKGQAGVEASSSPSSLSGGAGKTGDEGSLEAGNYRDPDTLRSP